MAKDIRVTSSGQPRITSAGFERATDQNGAMQASPAVLSFALATALAWSGISGASTLTFTSNPATIGGKTALATVPASAPKFTANTATLKGTGWIQGQPANLGLFANTAQIVVDGYIAGQPATLSLTTAPAAIRGDIAITGEPASLAFASNGTLVPPMEGQPANLTLTANPATGLLLRYGSGPATSLQFTPAPATLVGYAYGTTVPVNFAFKVNPATGQMRGLMTGSSTLALTADPATLRGTGRMQSTGTGSLSIAAFGTLSAIKPIVAKPAALVFSAKGTLTIVKTMATSPVSLRFLPGSVTMTTGQAARFRNYWTAYFNARQDLLNKLIEKNRNDITAEATARTALTTRVSTVEGGVTANSNSITALDAKISTKTTTFVQGTTPGTSDRVVGDTWIHTGQNNAIYTWDGSQWALRNLDAGITVFAQTTAPTAKRTGDLWFDTGDNNKQYMWNGAGWLPVSDGRVDAHATAIQTLNTDVSTINGQLSSQGTAITNLQTTVNDPNTGVGATASAVQTLKTTAVTSPNLLANTAFRFGANGTGGWSVAWNSANNASWSFTKNQAGANYQIPYVNNIGAVNASTPPAGQYYALASDPVPVRAGQKYGAQVVIAQQRMAEVVGILEFYNSVGTALGSTMLYFNAGTVQNPSMQYQVGTGFSGGTSRGGWAATSAIMQAPANAVVARLWIRGQTSGSANPYFWFCEPMLEVVSTDRTAVSPYAPGGGEAMAGVELKLDANGYVAGYSFLNNGQTADFVLLADSFKIASPNNPALVPFEVKNGNTYIKNAMIENLTITKLTEGTLNADMQMGLGRIIFDNGTYMKVQGVGFGSANQFIEWFGPKMAISSCTEANAISYLKTNGSAYFGGTLSAGTLHSNATYNIQYLQPNAANSVVLTHYSSRGESKSLTVSFSDIYSSSGRFASAAGASALLNNHADVSGTVTVQLLRGTTVIATWTITAASQKSGPEFIDDGGPNPYYAEVKHQFVGSWTFTDTSTTVGDLAYTVKVAGYSGTMYTDSVYHGQTAINVVEE